MTISAIDALNNWKNAIDNGDLAGLDNMLADDFIFENRAGDKDDKNTVLEWANDADFTCNEFIVCLLYTSPSPRDYAASRMPSSA